MKAKRNITTAAKFMKEKDKMKKNKLITLLTTATLLVSLGTSDAMAQQNLPFKKAPSASKTGVTLAESEHQWRQEPNRLPKDA